MTTRGARQQYHLLWSKIGDGGITHPFLSIGCSCHQEHHPCLGDSLAHVGHYLTFPWRAVLGQRPERHGEISASGLRLVWEICLWVRAELQQFLTLPGQSKLFHREGKAALTRVVIIMTSSMKSPQWIPIIGLRSSRLSARPAGQKFSWKSWSSRVYNYRQWASKEPASWITCVLFLVLFSLDAPLSRATGLPGSCTTLAFRLCFMATEKKIIGFNRFSQSYYLLNLPRSLLI